MRNSVNTVHRPRSGDVMLARSVTLIIALIVSLFVTNSAQAVDDKDIIVRKNGTKISAYVETETVEGVYYRTIRPKEGAPTSKPNLLKARELETVIYYGMDSGPYAKGVSERDAGNYEAAAEYFNQAALAGSREWEKVYGSIAEGECWELAKKFKDAAKAYAVVVDGFGGDDKQKPPLLPHRLWLDSKYHLGMAQAQDKNDNAKTIADDLEAFGRKEGLSAAEARANGIRAAIAAADNNENKFKEFMKKTSVRSFDEPEVWFHFKLYSAETYRSTFQKGKEAASIYREILSGLRNDPARQAQISLGLGLTLMESDQQSALVELLKLDVMPYGSPDQKCEARYNAGRLLWDEAQAIKNNAEAMKDERKAQFVVDTERAARLVVSAAVEGPPRNPNVGLAKSLLTSFGPDPDAVPEKEKKPEPKKEPEKKAPEKKEDPKKPAPKKPKK